MIEEVWKGPAGPWGLRAFGPERSSGLRVRIGIEAPDDARTVREGAAEAPPVKATRWPRVVRDGVTRNVAA